MSENAGCETTVAIDPDSFVVVVVSVVSVRVFVVVVVSTDPRDALARPV